MDIKEFYFKPKLDLYYVEEIFELRQRIFLFLFYKFCNMTQPKFFLEFYFTSGNKKRTQAVQGIKLSNHCILYCLYLMYLCALGQKQKNLIVFSYKDKTKIISLRLHTFIYVYFFSYFQVAKRCRFTNRISNKLKHYDSRQSKETTEDKNVVGANGVLLLQNQLGFLFS